MAFNQVILEGQLASAPETKEDTVEFFLGYEGGFDGHYRALFCVELWRGWTDLRADLRRAKPGDQILVLGHLIGHPWQTKIHAVVLKRLKKPFPWRSASEPHQSLITDEDRPL
jgi:hypothetical protein